MAGRKATGALPVTRRIQPETIKRLGQLEKAGISLDIIIARVHQVENHTRSVMYRKGLLADKWEAIDPPRPNAGTANGWGQTIDTQIKPDDEDDMPF
jgi:hypothetical protein